MRVCPVTKKSSLVGGRYSNRTRATQFNPCGKVRRSANFQKKKIYIPELQKSITLTLSAKGIKTINKNGAFKTLKKAGLLRDMMRPTK
jgi:large subunit ribosomal protein L28